MEKRLFVFDEICSGCRGCEMWCSFANKREFSPSDSRIKIVKDPTNGHDMPIISCGGECPHPYGEEGCPICVEMCPTGALIYADGRDAYEKRLDLHAKRSVQPAFRLVAPWKWPYPWREWNEGR